MGGLHTESVIKQGNWDLLAGFPWVDLDRITGSLGVARVFDEKEECDR